MLPIIFVYCTIIVVVSMMGGLLPLATMLNHTRLQLYLSLSAGVMLGAAFFHMLPEAVRIDSPGTIRWSAVGLLMLFFLERFFSFHHHETQQSATNSAGEDQAHHHHDHDESHHHHSAALESPTAASGSHALPSRKELRGPGGESAVVHSLPWGSAAFGLAVHSVVGGVALASAAAADSRAGTGFGPTGWVVFIATAVHKPADALTIATLMVRAEVPRWVAHLVNLGFALMIPCGVALFFLGKQGMETDQASIWTATALSFSSGTFLCIALSDLLPELQFHSHDRLKLSCALLIGFLLMVATSFLPERAARPHRQTPKTQVVSPGGD